MGDTICPVHVCANITPKCVSAFNPGSVSSSVLASKVMGLILLPLSQRSQITACFFSPSPSLPPPLHPLCLPNTLPPSPPLPSFPLSMMVSLSNQTAGQLSAWWLYGREALSLSISLLPFPLSRLLSVSISAPSSSFLSFAIFLSLSPSERDYRIRGNVFSWKICCNFQNGCFA